MLDAVQKTEKRWVKLETSGSSGMPPGLELNYEEDFLHRQSHQIPGVFTDPLLLCNMVNSVYKLAKPLVLAEAPPFTVADDHPTTPMESVDGKDGTPSQLFATLMLSQIKLIWNPRKIHLTQLKCSLLYQIIPSRSRLVTSQSQRTPKTGPLPPRGQW